MNINEKLIGLRRAKGLSQEQLANLIDVSRQAVSKWETAESQPDLAKLILLSNVFEVSLDELCGRETLSVPALPAAAPKPRIGTIWLCAVALVIGLAVGLAGGFLSADLLFPEALRQKIENVTITSVSLYPELYKQKLRVLFSPSVANDAFDYKVVKTDSNGNISSFPATYAGGVCTCDVTVNVLHGDFMLQAVMSDGTNEYTAGLVKIINPSENGYGFEELWNK